MEPKTYNENIYHKHIWRTGEVQIHVKPPPIMLIKVKNDTRSENDCVEIKLPRYPMPEKLDMYYFKMALFDNREP